MSLRLNLVHLAAVPALTSLLAHQQQATHTQGALMNMPTAVSSRTSQGRGGPSRIRRALGVILAIPILGIAVLSGAQPAAAAITPGTTIDNGYTCDYVVGRRVMAHPPYMNSSSQYFENVAWQPVLQKWNGTSWANRSNDAIWRGDVQGQWMKAAAGPSGIAVNPGWTNQYNGRFMAAFTFNNLEPGHYRVVNVYYRYAQNSMWSQISWYRTSGGGYCTLS